MRMELSSHSCARVAMQSERGAHFWGWICCLQATGVEPSGPGSSPVSGARSSSQSSQGGAASTSGRPAGEEAEADSSLLARITAPIKALAMRGTVYTSFMFAKQPKRIRQVERVCCTSTVRTERGKA